MAGWTPARTPPGFDLTGPCAKKRDGTYFQFHLVRRRRSTRIAGKTGLGERTHLYRKLRQPQALDLGRGKRRLIN